MFVFKGKQLVYARKDEGTGDHAPLDDVFDVCCKVPVAWSLTACLSLWNENWQQSSLIRFYEPSVMVVQIPYGTTCSALCVDSQTVCTQQNMIVKL